MGADGASSDDASSAAAAASSAAIASTSDVVLAVGSSTSIGTSSSIDGPKSVGIGGAGGTMKGTDATADAADGGAAGAGAAATGAGAAATGAGEGAGEAATGAAGAAASTDAAGAAAGGAAPGAGREERRTPVPRRDAFGGSASGSLSGTGSSDAEGRTESPTAMMRIAKIAEGDAEGGGNAPGGLDAGAVGGAAASDTEGDESARKRGAGGGSLRGRGGVAIGRSAFAVSFAASPLTSAGSEGVRVAGDTAATATSGNEGLERRRIGGGWLSGAAVADVNAASVVVDVVDVAGGSFKVGTLPEKEIVGAIGAFSALAEAAKSGPSPGRAEGGADAAPESRLGLGGGASLRENGGDES